MIYNACKRIPLIYSILVLYFSFLIKTNSFSQIIINEVLPSNIQGITNPLYGENSDWIELYNKGQDNINLEGFYLSDNPDSPTKWRINDSVIIGPSKFLLIWADGRNTGLHANFKLDIEGEGILLHDKDTILMDHLIYPHVIADISAGKLEPSDSIIVLFENPTPEAPNDGKYYLGRAPEPFFSHPSGFYAERFMIGVTAGSDTPPNAIITYTNDGSEPQIDSKTSPEINLFATCVVRAKTFREGYLPSPTVSNTYFINERLPDLPVVSLATAPDNLWDDEIGIHVVGTNGIDKYGIVANYNQDWERPIFFEYFSENGKSDFQLNGGIKIYGQYSRKRPQKSLAIFARKQYGSNELNYPLFSEKANETYKTFVLRNSGNDWVETMFSDAYSNYIVKDMMDIDYMAYQPAAVYINGEYWGILNMREKINEHYVTSNYGMDSDKIDMLESSGDLDYRIVSGTNEHYLNLRTFFAENDLSLEKNYEYAKTQIDLDEFINYQITEIYVNNTDWPGNNIKYWRYKTGGKWRWILFDVDRGFGIRGAAPDAVKGGKNNMIRASEDNKYTFLLHDLLENQEFTELFLQRFMAHINITFDPVRCEKHFNSMKNNIKNEMFYHLEKWGNDRDDWGPYDEKTIEGWEDIIQNKIDWGYGRPAVMKEYLKEFFNLDETIKLTLSLSDSLAGSIVVNDVKSPFSNFTGSYFSNIPIRLNSITNPGYRFTGWSGDNSGKESSLIINPQNNISLKANFDSYEVIINEIMTRNESSIRDNYGEADDWIELYNKGEIPVDIGGMYLSDSLGHLTQWKIPDLYPDSTTIYPGEYMILWADADTTQGILHLGFKLNAEGESLILTDTNKTNIIDQLTYNQQYADVSFGRNPESLRWEFATPSPGSVNNIQTGYPELYINEILAINSSTIYDEYGEFNDWIEIYNNEDFSVDIGGMFISDDLNDPLKFRIPDGYPEITTIPEKGFLVIWADGNPDEGILHLDFKLSGDGEYLVLTSSNGLQLIDSLIFSNQSDNISLGRYKDGSTDWTFFNNPTPGSTNFVDDPVLITEILDKNIIVFPNPARNRLFLSSNIELNERFNIQLCTITGDILIDQVYQGIGNLSMDLLGIESGIYLLIVKTMRCNIVKKVIVQK